MLDRVTITGADDTVAIQSLMVLSDIYPFVEWGILVSAKTHPQGAPRYPSGWWRAQLMTIGGGMNISIHVQGAWLRDLLKGDVWPLEDGCRGLLDIAKRIQFNFHGGDIKVDIDKFYKALDSKPLRGKQFIFQHDNCNGAWLMQQVFEAEPLGSSISPDCVAFYDTSHGAGVLPEKWPEPEYMHANGKDYLYHGYAGGLGPDNLLAQLPRIIEASKGCRFWIDMETKVRSDDGLQLPIMKVKQVLDICDPFIDEE